MAGARLLFTPLQVTPPQSPSLTGDTTREQIAETPKAGTMLQVTGET